MRKIALTVILAAALLASCGTPGAGAPPKEGRKGPFTNKRGVSYSFEQDKTPERDMALLTSANGIKWFYNWYVVPEAKAGAAAKAHDVVFYPMVWNAWEFEPMLEAYLKDHPEIDFLMGFNEPNLTDQCNYTPKEAARHWPRLVKFAKKHNLKILSPAMNFGTLENYWVPWVWLDEFFGIDRFDEETGKLVRNKGYSGVSLNDIDAISIHSYMPDAGALKWFISQFLKYKKPIWVTEFCSWEYAQPNAAWQNAEYQQMFMSEAVTMLELHPDVERYAWFIPKGAEDETVIPGNKLLTKGPNPRLTPLGTVFVNMGTCDKTAWVSAGRRIAAAQFSDMIFSDYIYKTDEPNWPRKEQGFTKNSGVHFRPGTDPGGSALDMFDFSVMKWVEYQVEVPAARAYTLSLRNTAEEASRIAVTVNGSDAGTVVLPRINTWRTTTASVQMPAGKNKLRLKVLEGDCALNWLMVE
jgi:hypothetical protein